MNKNKPNALSRLASAFLELFIGFFYNLIVRKKSEEMIAIQIIYNVYKDGIYVGKETVIVKTPDREKAVEAFENYTKDRDCIPEDFVAIVSKLPRKATVIEPIS
jgi:hypothetical protein